MTGKHILVNLRKFGTAHYSKLSAAKVDTCPISFNERIEKRLSFKNFGTKIIKLGGQNSNIKKKNDVAFNCQETKSY